MEVALQRNASIMLLLKSTSRSILYGPLLEMMSHELFCNEGPRLSYHFRYILGYGTCYAQSLKRRSCNTLDSKNMALQNKIHRQECDKSGK